MMQSYSNMLGNTCNLFWESNSSQIKFILWPKPSLTPKVNYAKHPYNTTGNTRINRIRAQKHHLITPLRSNAVSEAKSTTNCTNYHQTFKNTDSLYEAELNYFNQIRCTKDHMSFNIIITTCISNNTNETVIQ